MADSTPISSKLVLLMIGGAAILFIVMALFLTVDRPEGDTGADAALPAPEQQVEEGNADMPVSPRRPSPPLED
jgi:hypothetical protein